MLRRTGPIETLKEVTMQDQAMSLRLMANKGNPDAPSSTKSDPVPAPARASKVIAITSGKGGVGKTNVVANLAIALSTLGKQITVVDADLGLANIDVLLGLVPKFHLGHLINGTKAISEIMLEGPEGIKIIPASSGIQQLTELTEAQRKKIMDDLLSVSSDTDFVLVDTAAGISDNVMHFLSVADEVIVVCAPEPTAIVDGYAVIKAILSTNKEKSIKILVNSVENSQEAQQVFAQINRVVFRFLSRELKLFGYVYADTCVHQAVKGQTSVVVAYPNSRASLCFKNLARQLINNNPQSHSSGKTVYTI